MHRIAQDFSYLTNSCDWWLETGSMSSMSRGFIDMDGQDAQDFFWRRPPCSPGHPQIRTRSSPESASRAAASRPAYPVHPVHRCSVIRKTGLTRHSPYSDRPSRFVASFSMIRPTRRGPDLNERGPGVVETCAATPLAAKRLERPLSRRLQGFTAHPGDGL